MHVDIAGVITDQGTWGAFGQFRDVLASDTAELSLLGGQDIDTTIDRNLTVIVPARLEAGTFTMGRYVYGQIPAIPAAYVIVDTSFFASLPGGTLTITSAAYPPRPGLEHGLMNGTMTFRAVRLTQGVGGPVETHDTITVHSTFAARWYHYLRPNVTATLTGASPVLGTSLVSIGQAVDDDHGGWLVDWQSDFDRLPTQSPPYEISQEFRLGAPAVGTFPLSAITPVAYADTAQWSRAFAALYFRDDPRIGFTTGGTLTVTQYIAPTVEYYGEIHGTLTGSFALWSNPTTVTADTVQANVSFAVQLYPLGGIPAAAKLLTAHSRFPGHPTRR
jgi:hypothetical protein